MEAMRRCPRWTTVCRAVLTLTVCRMVGGGVVPGAAYMDCPRQHFGWQVKRCLQPYWSVAALVTTSQEGSNPAGVRSGLAKRLCLRFEIALVCLHSALTQCPSPANMQYVQSKLGSDWAREIRNLCVGQSGPSTRGHVHGEDSTAALTQAMEPRHQPSSPPRASATTDEGDVMDDRGDVDKEIIVLVPKDELYHNIVVHVRQAAKLKPRYRHHRHRHQRLQAGWLRLPVMDIQVYSDMLDVESRTLAAKSAASASAATTTTAMASSIVVTVFVMIGFSSPVVWF